MNIAIIEAMIKWISLLLVGFTSLFSGSVMEKEQVETLNINNNKSNSVINEIIPYQSKTVYNSKLPSTITKVVVPGEVGLQTKNENNEMIVVKEPVEEVIEKGTGAAGIYVGKITGYGPDCAGCSATGTVACYTKNKEKHSLVNDGIYYEDEDFGSVRILSAASAIPCGTIIKIDNGVLEPFYGVVLDRGGSMNRAWNSGTVWIDLAYSSNNDARNAKITGNNIKFEVQRWGF